MAILKAKDISKMSEKEINEKINDLKLELIKNQINSGKGGKLKTNEIKRTVARLLTFNRLKKESVETN
jgi:ribosomal protein L29|tara:strand:- start:1292 stop:1495 length:204 start_codon:yes stop_codon:yes gene_type:complete